MGEVRSNLSFVMLCIFYLFRDYSPCNFDDFKIHFTTVCAFEWIKGNYKVNDVFRNPIKKYILLLSVPLNGSKEIIR